MMNSPSLKKYLVLSIFLHLLFVSGFYLFEHAARPTSVKDTPVEIDILNETEYKKIVTEKQRALQKPIEVLNNQVVEQITVAKTDEEVDSRFLSESNQKVERQTVAKDRGEFQNLKKSEDKAKGSKAAAEKNPSKQASKPKTSDVARDLFKTYDHSETIAKQALQDSADRKELNNGNGDLAQGDDGGDRSQTNDYIKNIDQGLETLLNTREFKYYSYYNRIRRQLSLHWEGRVREKLSTMFNQRRSPAATREDRITKLMIILNNRGTLVRVQVLHDSGISDLDDAAIEAFRAAAPFPNPPEGIVEEDGTVKIRWDFVIEA